MRKVILLWLAIGLLLVGTALCLAKPLAVQRTTFDVKDPDGRIFSITLVRTASHAPKEPLLVYLPGHRGTHDENDRLLNELAIRGYTIAALDDFAASIGTRKESREDAEARDVSIEFPDEAAVVPVTRLVDRRVELAARQVSSALDVISAKAKAHPDGMFSGLQDLQKVGAMGFSLGGGVAASSKISDSRIVAAVNMDGWLFGQAEQTPQSPYMVFYSREAIVPPQLLTDPDPRKRSEAAKTLRDLRACGTLLTAPGAYAYFFDEAYHHDFHDDGRDLTNDLANALSGKRYRMHIAKVELIDAFFKQYTSGQAQSPLLSVHRPFPHVTKLTPELTELLGKAA